MSPDFEIDVKLGSESGIEHALYSEKFEPVLYLACRHELTRVHVECSYEFASIPRGPRQQLESVTVDARPAPRAEHVFIARCPPLPLPKSNRAWRVRLKVQEGRNASVAVTVVPTWQHRAAWLLTSLFGVAVLFLWAYLWVGIREQDTTLSGVAKVWGTVQGLGLVGLIATTKPWARGLKQWLLVYRARFAALWLLLGLSLFLPGLIAEQVYNATGAEATINGVTFAPNKWTLYWRWLARLDAQSTGRGRWATVNAARGFGSHPPPDRILEALVPAMVLSCRPAEWKLQQPFQNGRIPDGSCEGAAGADVSCVSSRSKDCEELPLSLTREVRDQSRLQLYLTGNARRLLTTLSVLPFPADTWEHLEGERMQGAFVSVKAHGPKTPVELRVEPINDSRPDTAGRADMAWWMDWTLRGDDSLRLPGPAAELPAVKFLFANATLSGRIVDAAWDLAAIETRGLLVSELARSGPHAHYEYDADAPGERAWSLVASSYEASANEEPARLTYVVGPGDQRYIAFPRAHLPPKLQISFRGHLEGTLTCSVPAAWRVVYVRQLLNLSGTPLDRLNLSLAGSHFDASDPKAPPLWACMETIDPDQAVADALAAPKGPIECGIRNGAFYTDKPDKSACSKLDARVPGMPSSCKTFYDCT